MDISARGAYITLLCHCWLNDSIPDDDEKLAILSGAGDQWNTVRESVLSCFDLNDDVFINERLAKEKKKQNAYKKQKSEAGIKSGLARKVVKNKQVTDEHPLNPVATQTPDPVATKTNSSIASASASSTADKDKKKIKKKRDCDYPVTDKFVEFWDVCPKKQDRKKCAASWIRRDLDSQFEKIRDSMIEHAEKHKRLKTENKYIPSPLTWLNGDRWEDIIEPTDAYVPPDFDGMRCAKSKGGRPYWEDSKGEYWYSDGDKVPENELTHGKWKQVNW